MTTMTPTITVSSKILAHCAGTTHDKFVQCFERLVTIDRVDWVYHSPFHYKVPVTFYQTLLDRGYDGPSIEWLADNNYLETTFYEPFIQSSVKSEAGLLDWRVATLEKLYSDGERKISVYNDKCRVYNLREPYREKMKTIIRKRLGK